MYCKFCGNELNRETMKCVNCGKSPERLEGGVGFWDLVGGGVSSPGGQEKVISAKKLEEKLDRIALKQKSRRKSLYILTAVIAVVVFMCALSHILMWIQLNDLYNDYEYLSKRIQDVEEYLDEDTHESESHDYSDNEQTKDIEQGTSEQDTIEDDANQSSTTEETVDESASSEPDSEDGETAPTEADDTTDSATEETAQ